MSSSDDPNAADATALSDAIQAAAEVTARAQSYRLRDGTSVQRPQLRDLLQARRSLLAEEAARARGGLYRRVGFGRPQ